MSQGSRLTGVAGEDREEIGTNSSNGSRMSRPMASIAKYVALATKEKRTTLFDLNDHIENEQSAYTPEQSKDICIIPSSDPTVSNDPIILEAATMRHQHPADLNPTKPHDTKNFIIGDSKILILYASGSIGLQKDDAGLYRPSRGNLQEVIKTMPMLCDASSSVEGVLVTPPSYYGKRVRYEVKELDPIIDSACTDMHDWVKLATLVGDEYDKYDGFVVLHGTDTLTYTATALSFMLEHLGKTVVFTGSLVPLCEPRNDALSNLLDAITIAGHFVIPEVCIVYGGKLMRGCRAIKLSSTNSNSVFDTPNCPPLGKAALSIDIDWRNVRHPNTMSRLKLHTTLCPDVSVLHLFPGITVGAVKAVLQSPSVRGIVLRTFGTGTAPAVRHDILQALKNATSRGVVVISISQCMEGTVSLEMGRALMRVGVVPGVDMTLECALVKLSFLLGVCKGEGAAEIVSKLLTQDLRGELTVSVAERFNPGSDEFLSKLTAAMDVNSEGEGEDLRDYLNNIVMCNAAQSGDLSSIKLLVESEAGWKVDVQDYDSRTPLHIAAAGGHSDVAEYLIKNGARVHHKDRWGYTPLMQAVLSGNSEAAATMATAGGVLGLSNSRVMEHLNQAILSKDATRVQLLLEHGADLQPADPSRMAPLHLAVQQGNLEIVRMLLDSGRCNLNGRDWWGYSPLDVSREAQSRAPEPGCYVYDAISDVLVQAMAVCEDRAQGNSCEIDELVGDTIDT